MKTSTTCLYSGLCIAALIFAFFPTLYLPLIIDDLDVVDLLKTNASLPRWIQLNVMLKHCMSPHYFRPLCAPIFLFSDAVSGSNPVPLRATMILLHLAAAGCIHSITRELSKSESAARAAFFVYAFSLIHWETLSMITNFGQTAAHFLFWAALGIYVRNPKHVPKPWDFGRILALITLALFFKEDVIAFPAFALAAGFHKNDDKKRLWLAAAVFSIWAAGYLACRCFILPGSFLSPDNLYTFSWHGLTIWKTWLKALAHLVGGLFPMSAAWFSWQRSLHPLSPLAGAWAVFAVFAGIALGRGLWSAIMRQPASNGEMSMVRLGLLGGVGFVAGLIPYTLFIDTLGSPDTHRFALSCGALSIGLGGWVGGLIVSLPRAKKPIAWTVGVGTAMSFILTATAIRYPDPECESFARVRTIRETQRDVSRIQDMLTGSLQDGDRLTFVGFDPVFRIPALFQILEPKSIAMADWPHKAPPIDHAGWIIERSLSDGEITVTAAEALDKSAP